MAITVNIYYKGQNGSAGDFAREMTETGVVDRIRAEEGNLRYEYFVPIEDPETVLLIDRWRDQAALDFHHKSPMMAQIADQVLPFQQFDLCFRDETFPDAAGGFG